MEEFENDEFAVVILDLMLPRLSGEQVCNRIRKVSSVPIIILTAKGTVEDRVIGLELGADDYLVKPFSPRELVARVRALLRRAGGEEKPTIDLGDIVIDTAGHKVFEKGAPIDMTASEYKLLVTLASSPGRVFTRAELVRKVLGYDFAGYERSIDSHVKNLRAKLGDDPKTPKWLFTVHGIGYRFELGNEEQRGEQA
jgi:DNA-binding response OmpR family regulator